MENLDRLSISDLEAMELDRLMEKARALNIKNVGKMSRSDVICALVSKKLEEEKCVILGGGVIDIVKGIAYARSKETNYLPGACDIYVPGKLMSKYELKEGHLVEGELALVENKLRLKTVEKVQGKSIEERKKIIDFDALVPDFPRKRIKLEVQNGEGKGCMSCRVLDLLVPMGFGQRALIVAPPKSGKTMLMQSIAKALEVNHPEARLMVLLVDERPEEVTDMKRWVKGEVISSNFDESAESHTKVAEMTINRAKRFAEEGEDVVILLDSLTRLARAYNVLIPNSGRVLSGGMDINAMQKPKKLFGAGRNLQNCGSVTVIATTLVDTGSKMDEFIKEELKGRGNCEVVLDRRLAELGIFPAIDIACSGTRRDELIKGFYKKEATLIRSGLAEKKPEDATKALVKKLNETTANQRLLEMLRDA